MCGWIQMVIIPIIPSALLSSRLFISFPFCWFWFTHGNQRAPSKGGEPHPQGTRLVRPDICSFWRMEMIWNHSWLLHCCLGFTESEHKDIGLRAHVCDCVVSAWLCLPPSLRHSVLYLHSSSVWCHRLIPIAIYIGYVLTQFIKPSVVIPNWDPSLTGCIRNDSKYCTRWARRLLVSHRQ